ncbi:TPA: AAA family ATPase [Klebsiella pneumoniae]
MSNFVGFDVIPGFGTFNFITGDNGTGKTRFLTMLANNTLKELLNGKSSFNKLICLTSTVYEKFPRPLKKHSNDNEFYDSVYSYFGGRVNNNIFSDISPFRTIVKCYSGRTTTNVAYSLAEKLMSDLGFSSSVQCLFRDENYKNETYKNNLKNKYTKELMIDFSKPAEYVLSSERFAIKNSEFFLLDMKFFRFSDSGYYGIRDLSSGERNFMITILSLIFSLKNNSLVLFDEPENSMHPKWQEKITSVIKLIVNELSPESTVVIATHSPLVVSSVSNERVYLMNLPGDRGWVRSNYSGNNSDTVLKEQFGLLSSRSLGFVMKFQECLKLYSQGENNLFIEEMDKLFKSEIIISENDPLYEAYNTMQDLYLELKQQ